MKNSVKTLCQIGVVTAVIAILAPLSIPIGAVPLSLTNLAICFTVYLVGFKAGTLATLCYIILGAIGLPIFSGFAGGLSKLAGPTGGYIIGFIILAMSVGYVSDKYEGKKLNYIIAMVIGMIIDYVIGTIWFIHIMHTTLGAALMACVVPFLIGDGLKVLICAVTAPKVKEILKKAIK